MAKRKRKTLRKGKKARGQGGSKVRIPELDLHPKTQGWIIGIGIGVLALFVFLSLIGSAGPLGNWLSGVLVSGFGWGAWFVPLIMIAAAWMVLRDHEDRAIPGPLAIGSATLLLSLLGLFGIMGSADTQYGGVIGYWISFPIVAGVRSFMASVIFIGVGAVGGLILWNFPAHRRAERRHEDGALPQAKKRSFGAAASELLDKVPSFKIKSVDRKRSHDLEDKPRDNDSDDEFKPHKIDSSLPFEPPPLDLLDSDKGRAKGGDIRANMAIIKRTFGNFHIPVEMGEVTVGPTVTQYTLKPAEGVRLSKISAFESDLSLALAAHPIRIEAPIPGRSLVGIEVPNHAATLVRLKNLLEEPEYREGGFRLPLAIGRNVAGAPKVVGLEKMPHLLIAGATGTGKTVGLNSIIMSLLYRNSPAMLRLILIDPKRVEFPVYNDIPHLLTPVIVDTEKTVHALRWAVGEMERRFDVLASAKSRDIESYNSRLKRDEEPLPYIVIVIDELADLMASRGRDIEAAIVRIAQMARAVGIHLIVATQRPSVEVITGLIKANITTRMAFQVASQIDSRTIIDSSGAEKLLGNGDMLLVSAESSKPKRLQGGFVSDAEVKKVAQFIKEQGDAEYVHNLTEPQAAAGDFSGGGASGPMEDDPLYSDAERLVIETRKASASYLQRRLRVGYARAARLIDLLEEHGVVGPGEGAKPREILIDGASDWEDDPDAEDAEE